MADRAENAPASEATRTDRKIVAYSPAGKSGSADRREGPSGGHIEFGRFEQNTRSRDQATPAERRDKPSAARMDARCSVAADAPSGQARSAS